MVCHMIVAYQFKDSAKRFAAHVGVGLLACVVLTGCGNKGDLYLEELELSDEQKQLLDELDDEAAKKKKSGATVAPQ